MEGKRKKFIQENIRDCVDMLPLANGLKSAKIEEKTQTIFLKATLSEFPYVIKEFYSDVGTSPVERPSGTNFFLI